MSWIHQYQLFLFDFDGLLVNTEEIHYQAYKKMCANRGFNFHWDFERYCQAAHYDANALRDQLFIELPALHAQEPDWSVLYAEKKKALRELLLNGAVQLMPGVEKLLKLIKEADIKCCVVTHSPDDMVSIIRQQLPILNTIPFWITREHYVQPKPNSECYLKAIDLLAEPQDKVIGFEDTPRGLRALSGTRAKSVIICQTNYPELPAFIQAGSSHFTSFDAAIQGLS